MGIFDFFKKRKPMYLYSEIAMETYQAYIAEQFGECSGVLHEIASQDIHLDILLIPPTEKNPYYKLITMGMGAYKMNVPDELKEYEWERAELVLYLPPDWNLQSSKEEDYWPVRQMKILGRLPIECNTWLGLGHTISSDAENTPYASNTNFCSMMLVPALNQNDEELDLRIEGMGKINFYQLFPLYKEELEYKQSTDAQTLLDRFSDADLFPVLNNSRRNYGINE